MKPTSLPVKRNGGVIGRNDVVFPDMPQTILGAMDVEENATGCASVYTGNDVVLYVFTPIGIRMDRPDSVWVACDANTAVLIPAHSRYHIDTTVAPQGSHHCWFRFQGQAAHPVFRYLENESGLARFRDPSGVVGMRMTEMATTLHTDWQTAFWPLQYQGSAVLAMLRAATKLGVGLYEVRLTQRKKEAPLTARVIDYLQKHLSESVTLPDLARAVRVSPSTLSHSYKMDTGETPLQTLRRIRIHRVKSLLIQNLSLAAIAEMTGFYDAHHVSREFRRVAGMTPTAFLEISMVQG